MRGVQMCSSVLLPLFLFFTIFSTPSPHSLDLIIFSFDRPMQLYALLESIETHFTGISHASVIYRASDDTFEHGYKKTIESFPSTTFIRHEGPHDFQPIVSRTIRNSAATHLFFAVDDIIVTDTCNLTDCVQALEDTHAYCFALRLGTNIRECYTCSLITPPPNFSPLNDRILSFQFGESNGDWDYPHSVDMNIYSK